MKPRLLALYAIACAVSLHAAEPAAPAVKPSVPAAKPTAPAVKPSVTAVKPTAPAAKPSVPAVKPSSAILQASAKNPKAPAASAVLPPPSSAWRISAGGQYRTLGDASFANRAQAPSFALPNFSGFADTDGSGGNYSDGYVLQDITGSATQTWNVGNDSASQVQGDQVTFHSSSFVTETTGRLHDLRSAEDADGWGGFLKVETPSVFSWQGLTLSGSLGYSFTRSETDSSLLAYSATQTTTGNAFADTYTSLGGPLPPILKGNFKGPGVVVSRLASRSGGGSDVIETNLESTIANELNVNLHTLSFGPQLNYQPKASPVRISASLGLALNVADWDAKTEETLRVKGGSNLDSWSSESSGTEVLPGFYLELSAELPITDRLSAYAAGRYDWSRDLQGGTDLSEHSLEMSGFTAQVGLNYKF